MAAPKQSVFVDNLMRMTAEAKFRVELLIKFG